MLPAVVFGMQGIEHLICYGKRLFAARAGIAVHDRAPALRPTGVGLAIVERFAGTAGPVPCEDRSERFRGRRRRRPPAGVFQSKRKAARAAAGAGTGRA